MEHYFVEYGNYRPCKGAPWSQNQVKAPCLLILSALKKGTGYRCYGLDTCWTGPMVEMDDELDKDGRCENLTSHHISWRIDSLNNVSWNVMFCISFCYMLRKEPISLWRLATADRSCAEAFNIPGRSIIHFLCFDFFLLLYVSCVLIIDLIWIVLFGVLQFYGEMRV